MERWDIYELPVKIIFFEYNKICTIACCVRWYSNAMYIVDQKKNVWNVRLRTLLTSSLLKNAITREKKNLSKIENGRLKRMTWVWKIARTLLMNHFEQMWKINLTRYNYLQCQCPKNHVHLLLRYKKYYVAVYCNSIIVHSFNVRSA